MSVERLHDATNAYLSTKHDVANSKSDGTQGSGQGIWPGAFCAPRIVVKATCSAFQLELGVQRRLEKRTLHITWSSRMSRLCEPQSGDHQKQVALAVLTLLGAGRAARELKTRRAQPRKRRVQKRRRGFRHWKGVQRAARGHQSR